MLDDLDYVFRNIAQDPVSEELKTTFNRLILNVEFHGDSAQKQALEEFESFGKIVLFRERPVKAFFHRRFANAAISLGKALEHSTV